MNRKSKRQLEKAERQRRSKSLAYHVDMFNKILDQPFSRRFKIAMSIIFKSKL